MRLLFICTGNRYRSQTAEIITRYLRPDIEVDSAGVSEKSADGTPTPKRVRKALGKLGYPTGYKEDFQVLRSKKITQKLYDWADYVIYMQPSHAEYLASTFPRNANKLLRLAYFSEKTINKIPDPAFVSDQEEFLSIIRLIEKCIKKLLFAKCPNRFPREHGGVVLTIQGTNGSGKSTVVRQLMNRVGIKRHLKDERGRTWAYRLVTKTPMFVLGRYETACGGCDTIPTLDEAFHRVNKLAAMGSVIFEGLLIGSSPRRLLSMVASMPNHKVIFAGIDTPLARCIKRVEKRRHAKGNDKPLNPANLEAKYKGVKRTQEILKEHGMDVRSLPHKDALKMVIQWLVDVLIWNKRY